jgi:Family of unknown function (DUF6502)
MTEEVKIAILNAFRRMLRPLVRILLRSGVTWREASDACKAAFVEVATSDFGLHGRPTSVSRVAILTGMARRDVSRIRAQIAGDEPQALLRMNSATRMLTGWFLDADFLDRKGQPRDLPFDGEGPSFSALARKYAGGTAAITMLKELLRVEALTETADGRLKVQKRYYRALALDPAKALQAGSIMEDVGTAVHHNLVRPAEEPARFVGRATNARIARKHSAAFDAFVEKEAQSFLERMDAWLSRHEAEAGGGRQPRNLRLGIGVFQIKDD